MDIKDVFKSQYYAGLKMFRQTIKNCPDELWNSPSDKNKFWHTAFHALFFTHFYLHPREEDYQPWEKHRDEAVSLNPNDHKDQVAPYTKAEIIEFTDFLLGEVDHMVDAVDLHADSGFHWKKGNKLEHQIENIRHLQHHTGELADRINERVGTDLNWYSINPD